MHGAGVIKAIEEKEVLGVKQSYYMIHLTVNNMKVMIPVDKASDIGIRLAVDPVTLEDILKDDVEEKMDPSLPWYQRQRVYMDKIKTGDIHDAIDVIRDISNRNKDKPLSSGEKGVWTLASQILISEMALVNDISEDQAEDLFDQIIRH